MKVTPKKGLCMGREFDVVQFVRVKKNGKDILGYSRHLCIYSEECRWLNQAKVDEFVRETEGEMQTPQGSQKTRFVEVKLPNGNWARCMPTDYIIMYDTFLYGVLTATDLYTRYKKVTKSNKTKVGN